MSQEELDSLKANALKQFKIKKILFGRDGAFVSFLKEFLEEVLDAKMKEILS